MRLDHVNVYLLDEGHSWTVIDTGMASKTSRERWQSLFEGPMCGKPVSRTIVTHHHPDHVGLAGWFRSDLGATLWTTRTSWLFLRILRLDEQAELPPETLAFYRRTGMVQETFVQRAKERPFNYANIVAPMPLATCA